MSGITFEELDISINMKRAAAEMGFCEATPIQAKAIPVLMQGRDIIAQARTGSGKTAAFAIPAIERINRTRGLQTLVICPTRELAIQVTEEFRKLFKFFDGLAVVTAYGGQDINIQLRQLTQAPQIVVGTPGRLIDHMWRGTIRLDEVNFVILDEADEMLNMGFRDDVEDILSYVPPQRQTAMFSATMSAEIMRLMKKYQNNPVHIDTTGQRNEMPKIEQYYCEVAETAKFETLTALINNYNLDVSLVFVNMKSKVDRLVAKLISGGYRAKGIHGGHEQSRREMVMDSFRGGSTRILVATDVAGRGIDISGIDAVINYDLPSDDEDYTHRIGRTGRAGQKGRSFTFVTSSEMRDITRIARNGGFDIRPIDVQTLKTQSLKRDFHVKEPRRDEDNGLHAQMPKRRERAVRHTENKQDISRRKENYREITDREGWITDSTGFKYRLI